MSAKLGTQDSQNTYTDAPELHSNLILGALQLLFWLFFHPSAWRSHVARIDPDLRPDFCLLELSREQWRNPALRRLLEIGYVFWLLLVGLLISLTLWGVGPPHSSIRYVWRMNLSISGQVAFCVMFVAVINLLIGAAFGVAFGIALGTTFVAVYAIIYYIMEVTGSSIITSDMMLSVSIVLNSMAVGIALGVTVNVAAQRPADSSFRQMGGAVMGTLIGGVVGMGSDLLGDLASESAHEFIGNGVSKLPLFVVRDVAYVIAGATLVGLIIGVALGWRIQRWRRGVVLGIVGGIVAGAAYSIVRIVAYNTKSDIAYGAAYGGRWGAVNGSWLALPCALATHIAGPLAGAIAGALGYGGLVAMQDMEAIHPGLALALYLAGVLSGLTLTWWRPVILYPFLAAWNLFLYRTDERRADHSSLLPWHSTFWDEHQHLPLFGLDDHLLLVMERSPTEGQVAIEYLTTSRQRWAAQAAQIELDARILERCTDAPAVGNAHHSLAAGELTGPASALLRSFSRLSQDVDAALRQESAYNQRLALSAVEDRLDGLLRELTRSDEPYAVRFHPIADGWRQIVAAHVRELAAQAEQRQEIDSPYIIGVPLTEQQEIFVGRTDVCARIEGLLLDRRRPPLLLYSQRRMGKTSLLNNLGRLLPSTIVPLFVDLQGPATQANDHAGLLYNLARGMVNSAQRQRELALPPLTRESLAADPFTRFDEWLDQVEYTMDNRGHSTALLALDEFEALDSAISQGRFDEQAVLGTLRNLIQHRPRFKVLLAGSHTLDELQRWASYLINVQVVHVGYLNEDETRQLVERPVQDFTLRYEPDASQRVLDLTRGHPALVQLLCAEIVALKNEQPPAVRRLARLEDVEAAIPEALGHGSFFFADIQRNQVDAAGLALLRFVAAQGEGAVVSRQALERQFSDPELSGALALLARRELIETVDDGYRFQVELIRRWFAKSSSKND